MSKRHKCFKNDIKYLYFFKRTLNSNLEFKIQITNPLWHNNLSLYYKNNNYINAIHKFQYHKLNELFKQ